MVMSGSSTDEEEVSLDWSFQNHAGELLRRGNHTRSNFRRWILDLTIAISEERIYVKRD